MKGNSKGRKAWEKYYNRVDAIIYMMDNEAKNERILNYVLLMKVINELKTQSTPVLVLINKCENITDNAVEILTSYMDPKHLRTENLELEQVMGKHGKGVINENGQHFVDFCATNDLVIGGTIF